MAPSKPTCCSSDNEESLSSEAEHAQLIHPRPPNVAFLLPMGGNPYLRLLGDKVRAVAQSKSRDEAQVRCYFIESFDVGVLAAAIRYHAGWADGIAFLAIDHPLVREAVEEVSAAGRRRLNTRRLPRWLVERVIK